MYFVGLIIYCLIWGFATSAVVRNKGYGEEDDKWFWLGFFFSFIAFIIALTKPVKEQPLSYAEKEREKKKEEKERQKEILEEGGWQCVCGRMNERYVFSCACGRNKSDGEIRIHTTEKPVVFEENSDAMKIKEFKELLDEGIITQEEFEAKKKQILGL